MRRSGAVLREVGTTNRTHLKDYAQAIGPETGLILKVHTSNYRVVGFTAAVSSRELSLLGRERGIPVMEDLGSGCLVDLRRYGFPYEPTVPEVVASGVDIVAFSGDKLLGGPQAGIVVGRAELVERLARNPLNRALRIDKFTVAALEGTLYAYEAGGALETLPTLRMLKEPLGAAGSRHGKGGEAGEGGPGEPRREGGGVRGPFRGPRSWMMDGARVPAKHVGECGGHVWAPAGE